MNVAMAVVRSDDPQAIVADSMETLDRALAFELVARTSSSEVEDPAILGTIRTALLEEQWGTAVAEWIGVTGVQVDVWTEEEAPVWSREMIDEELLGFEFQFSPIFHD